MGAACTSYKIAKFNLSCLESLTETSNPRLIVALHLANNWRSLARLVVVLMSI
jgi:hypothetical protein